MKQKNNLIISIVAVLLIIGLVVGATFAYWSWVTDTNQQTPINVTVPTSDDITATITGEGSITATNFIPSSGGCTGGNALKNNISISYTNNSGLPAKMTADLKLTSITMPHGTLPFNAKGDHIKWAITTNSASCSTDVVNSGTFNGLNKNSILKGNQAHTITIDNINSQAGVQGPKKYYLYVWMEEYNHQNIGNTNNDPLQDLTFELTWSGNIEQKH